MLVSKDEIVKLFNDAYDQDVEAAELKKGITEDFKVYAENHEMNVKGIKAAYSLFKKYKKGNVETDNDDYIELMSAVEEYFLEQESK